MKKWARVFTVCHLAVLAVGISAGAQEGTHPPGTLQLSPNADLHLEPVQVEVAEKFSQVPDDLVLNLPSGFSARIFAATGLEGPRFMAWSPDGVLHVANMKVDSPNQWSPAADRESGQIVALPDRDNDGVADAAIVVADGLEWAHSLAFYKGDLYVADMRQVLRFRDADGDGIYEEREVFIDDIPVEISPMGSGHITHTIVFDEENDKIYLSVGSSCDLCREENPERATVLQFNADGSGRRVFASGLRNAIGLTLHPLTNQLWGTLNSHDQEGRDLPPEAISIVRDGGFYGWPLAYGNRVWVDFSIERYAEYVLPLTKADSLLVQEMQQPVALVPAHLAPMAIHFYDQELFPPQYRHTAFVAFRAGALGSVPGYKVMALFGAADGSNARMADFLTGFQPDPARNAIWGKPVGITSDAQGNLYVSSDHTTHVIVRIEHGPLVASWEQSLPDSVLSGALLQVVATVRLNRFDAAGETPRLSADLSALGGSEDVSLVAVGDGTYRLDTPLLVDIPNGLQVISVRVEQGDVGVRLAQNLTVLPAGDLVVLGDGLAPEWRAETRGTELDFDESAVVYRGDRALALEASFLATVEYLPSNPVGLVGYTALRFAFHPGDVDEGRVLDVDINGNKIKLLGGDLEGIGVDLGHKDWQVVELPLELFALDEPLKSIGFVGSFQGTFYLDDMRLVAAAPPLAPTAVLAAETAALPQSFVLEQNYPNPFNSSTVIRFALPQRGDVELTVYNLTGQKVATLVQERLGAGSYTARWDGRDGQGEEAASGVYLYRLRAGGGQVETRKLLLLR